MLGGAKMLGVIAGKDPITRYKLISQVGHGGSGAVYKALDTHTQTIVAIKVINLEESGEGLEDVETEISMMCDVSCPQLVKYHCSYVVQDVLWIVMEFQEAGSLSELIKEFGPLDEDTISFVLHELLCALSYLHSQRKIHRDVKAGNVLLGRDGSVKLSDFGVTGKMTDSMDKRKTRVGTPFWMAPEVKKETYAQTHTTHDTLV